MQNRLEAYIRMHIILLVDYTSLLRSKRGSSIFVFAIFACIRAS